MGCFTSPCLACQLFHHPFNQLSVLNPICLQDLEDCFPGSILTDTDTLLSYKLQKPTLTCWQERILSRKLLERSKNLREDPRTRLRDYKGRSSARKSPSDTVWGKPCSMSGVVPCVPPTLDAARYHSNCCLCYHLSTESNLGISYFFKTLASNLESVEMGTSDAQCPGPGPNPGHKCI